ncbi:MAG TPA: dihydrodipicolinate synthase family protein [Candidatus Binatia bacterium]
MIKGVLIPLITPFDDKGRVDEEPMQQLVEFNVKHAVQGLFVLGSSGQGPVMSVPERKRAAEVALAQARSRVPVIIHVGTADAESTVELAAHAAEKGASAVAVVPPYYYSDHTEYEIIAHYKAVAAAVDLPIFIYENPKYSGISIPPDFAKRMKDAIPTLRGIKVAYGQGALLEYVRLFPPDVSVFTGNADLFGLIPFGLAGMINPPTSFLPELCVSLWRALDGKEYDKAVGLQERVNTAARLVGGALRRHGRTVLTEVFRMRGFAVKRFPKWDTQPMAKEARDELYRELKNAGLVEAGM